MLPSVVATQVRSCVADYLLTTFRPTTTGFTGLLERFVEHPDNYYRGPYVSVGLPFRPGDSGPNFFPNIPLAVHPHLHQEQAWQRLQAPHYQSTLIATGTGSGKTECFLLPLLDHCYQTRGTPGIKAIIIYPMNALATDQAKRIAELIYSTPALQGQVTAGLYIGEQDETPIRMMQADQVITDKNILRQAPSDILLTNYKMLDYLLIQPDVQSLWQQNQPETLRYLIVDEFHTFDGAQGTDLACLLRRLKHRLQTPKNHLACVGTSATLGSDTSAMLTYATKVFAEPFDQGAVIAENRISPHEFLYGDEGELTILPIPAPEQLSQLFPNHYPNPTAYLEAQAKLWLHHLAPQAPILSLTASPANNKRFELNPE